jgi:hypothetical protein
MLTAGLYILTAGFYILLILRLRGYVPIFCLTFVCCGAERGHAVVQLVKALLYNREGRWFDSR